MARCSITVQQNLAILRDKDTRLVDGETLKSVARSHGVQPSQILRWETLRPKLRLAKPKKWWDWMIGPAEVDAIIPHPSRDDIQQLVAKTWDSMRENIIENSWLKTDYSWFN